MKSIKVIFIMLFLTAQIAFAQVLKKEETDQLKFRHIGPVGNRVSCAIGIPGDNLTYFAGAATGGLWKTTDGGLNWRPVFDDKPVASVSALAAAASDRQIMFAGTGESFIRSNISIGNGIWKSTDGGETWTDLTSNLPEQTRVVEIIVDPAAPQRVYLLCERVGVLVSGDGGTRWQLLGKPAHLDNPVFTAMAIASGPQTVVVVGIRDEGGWRYTSE